MMQILNNAITMARLTPRAMMHFTSLRFSVVIAMTIYFGCLLSFGLSGRALGTVAAVAVAALLSSVAGFAFSAICGAIIFQFRQDAVDPVGVWLLLHLHLRTYTVGLGAILFLYGSYMLLRPPITLRHPPAAGDLVSGIIGGMIGGFAASPGAPVSIWCGMKGWNKVSQRAVFQPFILIMQLATLALIMTMRNSGANSAAIPSVALACVPAGLAGTWLGFAFFQSMTDRQFIIAINLMLIISGAGLIL